MSHTFPSLKRVRKDSGRPPILYSIAAALLAAIALVVWVSTIFGTLSHSYPSLFWDQWDVYSSYFDYTAAGKFWDWLFLNHNGHRFVIARLLMLLDMTLCGGSNHMILVLILSNQFLFGAIACSLACRQLKSWQSRVSVSSVTMMFLFSATQLENFTWSLQIQFVNVFLFALISFVLSDRFLRTGKTGYALGTMVFALLSSYSMANGILVWALLFLQAGLHRKWWYSVSNLLLFGIFIVFYFPHNHAASSSIGNLLESLKLDSAFLKFLLIYISNPLGKKSFELAYLFGALSLLLFFALNCYHLLKKPDACGRFRPGGALLMAAAFSLLTGLSTTLGRVDRGLINATAERYTTGAVVFAVCLLLYLVIHWQHIRTRRLLHILSTIWIVALGLYGSIMLGYQRFYLFHYGIQYHQKMVALNGIRNDCFDPNYSGFLYPDLHRHLHTIHRLRDQSTSSALHTLNTTGPRFSADTSLVADFVKIAALSCNDLEDKPNKVILYGSVSLDPKYQDYPIFLTRTSGEILGSGYLIRSFQSEAPFLSFVPETGNLLFYGHADRSLADAPFQLWLKKGHQLFLLAETQVNAVQHLSFATLLPLGVKGATASAFQIVTKDASWTPDGIYPGTDSPDWLHQVWGSWSGADQNKGSIRLSIQLKSESRSLLIPYVSGPASPGTLVTLSHADGSEGLSQFRLPPSSGSWAWVSIDVSGLPRCFSVEITENGTGWGQWIGIAEPYEK